jgi:hypothetical protein
MAERTTGQGGADVEAALAAVTPAGRREDARALDRLFRDVSGFAPVLWPGGIVGYGRYAYTYDSGHSGTAPATGFAARKAAFSIYIMPGYADFGDLLDRLGPHKKGAACLYVTRLARIDTAVLAELVRAGLDDLARHWPVEPT